MEWRTLTRVSGPDIEPLTPAQVYAHLRLVEDDAEKAYAAALIPAVRQYAENRNGIATTRQTWELVLDEWWDGWLDLPYPPLHQVESVKYLDPQGQEQTLDPSNYRVLVGSPVAQIGWTSTSVRPSLTGEGAAVRIRFSAGYATAQQVPKTIAHAMLILTGTWFENRESIGANVVYQRVPMTVEALLDQTRVRWW
jgi:uncharacterized phiE125 gp8 family phage protein